MNRIVGRVAYPERDVQWQYDPVRRGWVEYALPDVDELEQIGKTMEAPATQKQVNLLQVITQARSRGFTWSSIATILGVSTREARRRFGEIDNQLRAEGHQLPEDAVPAPASVPEPEPIPDFLSTFGAMTNEEIIAQADRLPRDGTKLQDSYLKALREAIVVTLYKRDLHQPKIAEIIGVSSQRISQLIAIYYDRVEREWKAERARWGKDED